MHAHEEERESRPGLSACVVAMNEEDRLGDCLASLAFCDEVVVVDSHSTDRTREIAREHGAHVFERDWPGFGAQKNLAIETAENDWVLCLDADERVSPELQREIVALRGAGFRGYAGWSLPRLTNYFGTWVRHGTWYPNRQVRLFDRRRGNWTTDRDPHDRVELTGPAGRLSGDLTHYPYRNFAEHLHTIDRYTTTMARGMLASGRRANAADILLRPPGRFLRFYVLKRGFLLGWRGLLIAFLAAHYVRLKYAKLFLLQRGHEVEGPRDAAPGDASAQRGG